MTSAKWLNCRLRAVQTRLAAQGHTVSLPVISRLLKAAGYRLRGNHKQLAGTHHPDRDTQFTYIQTQRQAHLDAGQPVISVDSKKKELIGPFKNGGQAWTTAPHLVNMHDFPSAAHGRAVPYGIYDLIRNVGLVYVGQSADTPEFAVDAIAAWCATTLGTHYPHPTRLLIEADGGGSNSARSQVWKVRLQERVAERFGLVVTVCHYPPGTSKWNPIEHRLFSEISKNWAGCPLISWEVLLGYIRDTTTSTGLRVDAERIVSDYPTGVQVTPAEWAMLHLEPHGICPNWNYTIWPGRAPEPP